MKKRILCVVGTRPEAIKMAPVILALQKEGWAETRTLATAQHRQMLDQVLNLFEIRPEFDLNLMKPGQDLTDITSNVLLGVRGVLREWRPDMVLVHGDTTTTMATALAAFYEKIPVGHVEAGLRTGNIYSPWPEEMNRRVAGVITALHFAPTEGARQNLLAENVPADRVIVTGNTVIDALLLALEKLRTGGMEEKLVADLTNRFPTLKKVLSPPASRIPDCTVPCSPIPVPCSRLILVTGHRRENFGEGFESICQALLELSDRPGVELIYPVHLNPNVQEPVRRILGDRPNVHLIEPLDYLPFIYLMDRSHLIITDSGGVQEEAPSLGKPVLVMRDTTERPEAVAAGTVKLVGTDAGKIVAEATRLLEDDEEYRRMARAHNPYGDGTACEVIIRALKEL